MTVITIIIVLLLLYAGYHLFKGTTSPTARGLTLGLVVVIITGLLL